MPVQAHVPTRVLWHWRIKCPGPPYNLRARHKSYTPAIRRVCARIAGVFLSTTFANGTRDAVLAFQTRHKLNATGTLDERTARMLQCEAAGSPGGESPDDLSELKTQSGKLDTIARCLGKLGDIDGKLAEQSNQIRSIAGSSVKLASIDGELDTQKTELTNIDTELGAHTVKLTSIEGKLDTQTTKLGCVDGKLGTPAAVDAELDTHTAKLTNMDGKLAKLDGVDTKLGEQGGQLKRIAESAEKPTSFDTELGEQGIMLGSIRTELGKHTGPLDSLGVKLDQQTTVLGQMDGMV